MTTFDRSIFQTTAICFLHFEYQLCSFTLTRPFLLLKELIYLFMPSLHEQQSKLHNETVVFVRQHGSPPKLVSCLVDIINAGLYTESC
jgi:hypothetical protein